MVGVRGPEAGADPPLVGRPGDGLFAVGGRLGHQRGQQARAGRHQHLLHALLLVALANQVSQQRLMFFRFDPGSPADPHQTTHLGSQGNGVLSGAKRRRE